MSSLIVPKGNRHLNPCGVGFQACHSGHSGQNFSAVHLVGIVGAVAILSRVIEPNTAVFSAEAGAPPQRGFGAAETAHEKTGKNVPVPTRKSVSADCPALDALRLLPPQRAGVPLAPKLSSGKGTVLPVFSFPRSASDCRPFQLGCRFRGWRKTSE
ncbi:MAG TPA: hypothetical protein VMV69_08345 [Pirellulales bacterium]|nr:hypothetical protein [Pirellulales bacterium]